MGKRNSINRGNIFCLPYFHTMKIFSIFSIFLFLSSPLFSQMTIESDLFKQTVDGLLSNSVDVIYVDQLLDTLEKVDWLILDAREKEEFNVSHLPNAVWVGFDDFDLSRVDKFDKNKTVIIYCSVGYRSEKIGEKLKEAGFKNVKNLYGGIFEWSNQGGSLLANNVRTNKVHGYNVKWSAFLRKAEVVLN